MRKVLAILLIVVMLCTPISYCVVNAEEAYDIEVTLPAEFFENSDQEKVVENALAAGVTECIINEDGSVTYRMTKEKHEEMLAAFKESLAVGITEMLEGEKKVDSFTAIEYDDDFTQFDVMVDSALYRPWDNFYVVAFYMFGLYYQNFACVDAEDMDVIVRYIDASSGEELMVASYKEYIASREAEKAES